MMAPSLLSVTIGISGVGSAAAAIKAAIFGPASFACDDQPAVSRRLTKLSLVCVSLSAFTSLNRGDSWVQPTIIGAPDARPSRKRSSSARHSWRAISTFVSRQPRRTAPASTFIVSSHEQRKTVCFWSVIRSNLSAGAQRGAGTGREPAQVIHCASKVRIMRASMPLNAKRRVHAPFAPALDLPPPFRAVALRESGDAFAHATRIATEAGAGTLVHVGRFDLAEFAV